MGIITLKSKPDFTIHFHNITFGRHFLVPFALFSAALTLLGSTFINAEIASSGDKG